MISYLGSLVQFSPAMGRAGCCRQISPCVFSTPRVPATLGLPHTGVSVFSPSTLLRLPAALYGAGPVLRVVPVFGSSTKARIQLRLRVVSSPPQQFRQPEACVPCPRAQRAFSLRGSGPGSQRLVHPLPRRSEPFPSVESGSGSQRLAPPLPGRGAPFPSAVSGSGSQGVGRPLPRCGAPFPSAAPACAGIEAGAAEGKGRVHLSSPWLPEPLRPRKAQNAGTTESALLWST